MNLPSDARGALRRLAKEQDTSEGELARALILDALRRAERQQLIERVARAQTPERRARSLEILRALEKWR